MKNTSLRHFQHLLVFQVAFQHQKSVELEKDENLEDDTDGQIYILQERSGNPYYKIGFPLITGRLDEDKVKPIDTWVWSSTKMQQCKNYRNTKIQGETCCHEGVVRRLQLEPLPK